MNPVELSIIIVNFNTRDLIRDCLASIHDNTKHIRYEIIVVDNASTDGSVDMLKADFPEVQLIANDDNRGFAAANNQGIACAAGRYVLLLNSDTLVLEGTLDNVTAFADTHPEAGVVGCRVMNPDRTMQPTCFMYPSVLNMFLSATYLYKLFPKNRFFGRERMSWWNRDDIREVDVVTGCFLLVRRSVLDEVGLLDEQYFVYGEETDFCYRVKRHGWKVLFTPAARIIHFGGASSKQIKPQMALQLRASILLFIKKHRGWLSYILASILVTLFFVLRIPYWLGRAIFNRSSRQSDLQTAATYGEGALRTVGGWKSLQFMNRPKVDEASCESVLCFGGGDWWYHNQAHIDMQIMRNFARERTVLYVNSVVIQKPKFGKGGKFFTKVIRKLKSIARGLRPSGEGFYVYSPFTLPVHHVKWLAGANERLLRLQVNRIMRKLKMHRPLVWVACPGACHTALKLKRTGLIWQRTDRWEEFPNVDSKVIREYDRTLKAHADLTVFVSSLLYETEGKGCKKAFYLDHGVDYDFFANAGENESIPDDLADVPGPIVGFFGGIDDHTFDMTFFEKVVDLLPEASFVLVGKSSIDCSGLLTKNNVRMLGYRPYTQIPHYGKCFDVAIMPWRQNDWIEACNPIKLKEYLALGKPIVSTPFKELEHYDGLVYPASKPEEFVERIHQALRENGPQRIEARRNKVEAATWQHKAALLSEMFFRPQTTESDRREDHASNSTIPSTKVNVLGIDINAMRMSEVLNLCDHHIANRSKLLVGIVNVAKAVKIRKDLRLRQSLLDADIALADGAGIVLLSRLTGQPLPERVTGIDLMYNLMDRADKKHYRVYFLGATQDVVTKVVDYARGHYPGLQVAGYHDGYFSEDEEEQIAHQIRDSRADILFVAMTSPKKENFLSCWRSFMEVPICHGVGGSFDIVAGLTKRAPLWMQKWGLEWLYRIYQEPGRMWKRYLMTNSVFLVLGVKEIVLRNASKLFRIPWRAKL